MIVGQDQPAARPVHWVGSSLQDLRAFPGDVRGSVGVALRAAQLGGKHDTAKPLRGFGGAGVLEIVEDYDGDTEGAGAEPAAFEERQMKEELAVTESSGNVFADLGLPDADERLAKADLAIEIGRVISERGLTQSDAAELMGVDQPKVSALVRGKLDGFSMERLYRYLNALGRDVEIVVRPTPADRESTLRVTPSAVRSRAAKVARRS